MADGPGLPHNHHLYLACKGDLASDSSGDVECQDLSVVVADSVSPHHDPHLPTRIDGVHVFHPLKGIGDFLQLHNASGVSLQILAPAARPNGRDDVCRLDQKADRIETLVFLVMLSDDFFDHGMLVEFLGELDSEIDVGSLELPTHGLANVV